MRRMVFTVPGSIWICVVLFFLLMYPASGRPQGNAKLPFTVDDVLNLRSFSIGDITDDGKIIIGTISRRLDRPPVNNFRYGDPTYDSESRNELVLFDVETRQMKKLFNELVDVSNFSWSPNGKTAAFFLRKGDEYFLELYDREKEKVTEVKLKTDKPIASNSILQWRPDGNGILLYLRALDWKEKSLKMYNDIAVGPIIVQDSKKPFLAWDEVRNRSALVIPAIIDLTSSEVRELHQETQIGGINQAKNGAFITYTITYPIKTVYTGQGGSEYEFFLLNLQAGGEPKSLRKRGTQRFSPNFNNKGDTYVYGERGDIFIQGVLEDKGRNLTKDYRTPISEKDTTKLSYSMMRWSQDDSKLLISSQKGYHLLDVSAGLIDLVYKFPPDRETAPTVSVTEWTPDGRYLYMTYSAKDKWERGLMKYDIQTRTMQELVKDGNLYSGWRFTETGDKILFNFSDGDLPENLYIADKDLKNRIQLLDLNPWINDRLTTKSELIKYRDSDGDEMYGILYYPVDFDPKKKYPLVCEIYESFFSNGWNVNMNLLANASFFGFRPSVNFDIGFPKEAWIKGVTAGINKVIERGFIDDKKLGVHGTSYGGYATNLLITETNRFAAAINISGKVDIISFLGDSPKMGVRNYNAAEASQDRIGATLWQQPQKYIEHSAVLYADRITTPLLLLTGEGDWNVPADNEREMYYALRRLGKECVWVHYMNGGHGAGSASTNEDFKDYWNRIISWYTDHFAKVDEQREKEKK